MRFRRSGRPAVAHLQQGSPVPRFGDGNDGGKQVELVHRLGPPNHSAESASERRSRGGKDFDLFLRRGRQSLRARFVAAKSPRSACPEGRLRAPPARSTQRAVTYSVRAVRASRARRGAKGNKESTIRAGANHSYCWPVPIAVATIFLGWASSCCRGDGPAPRQGRRSGRGACLDATGGGPPCAIGSASGVVTLDRLHRLRGVWLVDRRSIREDMEGDNHEDAGPIRKSSGPLPAACRAAR